MSLGAESVGWGEGMARRGRKRKWGARERNGQAKRKPKQEQIEERLHLARSQPHRRVLKSNDRISEFAESSLGRLSLTRIKVDGKDVPLISAGERAAGEAFASIVASYRIVTEGPRAVRSLMPETASDYAASADEQDVAQKFDCPSQYADPIEKQVQLLGRAVMVREWPCQLPGQVCACAERRGRYTRAYEAIAAVGRRALMAVIRVAVRGEEPSVEDIVYLKLGLRAAQRHLGLTDIDR
jgi:hypothetical protein